MMLVFVLAGAGKAVHPVSASTLPETRQDDPAGMRPEDYLLSPDNFPQALTDKYAGEVFINKGNNRTKLPNLYIAENKFVWDGDKTISTRIMVGVPGYWDGYYLRGEESFDRVKELQGMGEYALLLESSFCNEVHFIKGNSLVVVSAKRGGDGSDVQLLAQIIADQLPDELPHPDTWQLEVPEPARQLTLPGKYIYKVYKSGEQNVFFYSAPDMDKMHLVSRYPFQSFIMALWNVELQSYVYLEEVSLSIYDVTVLSGEHSARVNSFTYGNYEIHYWVNGEFAAIYPFTIQ